MATYNFAPYKSATHCVGSARPGTVALGAYLEDNFPKTYVMNIYSCREIFGGSGYSHHAEGRADDHGVPTTPSGGAITSIGMPIIELIGPHGRALGIDHMIYNRKIWTAAAPSGKYYSGKHPHRDHWHIGLTRTAAELLNLTTIKHIVEGSTPPAPEPPGPLPPSGDIMLPFKKDDRSEDIRWFKDRMNETFQGTVNSAGVAYKLLDISSAEFGDWYEDATVNRVRDFLGVGYTGHPDGIKGEWVGGNQFNSLELMWIRRKLNL